MAREAGSTSEPLTVESAASSVFDALLSDEPEYREDDSQTPPAEDPTTPAKSEPDEQDADPEPAESDPDESKEQDADPEEPGQEPPTSLDPNLKVKVKIDGKDEEVTLDEAIKGYSRTQDYTRKTQEVAEHRKVYETETASVRQERAKIAEDLKLLEAAIDQVRPKEPDWDRLQAEHPNEFQRIWIDWKRGEEDRAELRKVSEEAQRKVAEDQFKVQQERVVQEQQKLFDAVPEWKDAKVRSAEAAKMQAVAEKYGYTLEELKGINDHRALILLRKVMLHDTAEGKKAEAVKRIETVKSTKPGSDTSTRAPVSARTRALQRLAKTHSTDALASVFETILPD